MFRFTIRDVLWVMVVVGMACGWWLDRRAASRRYNELEGDHIATIKELNQLQGKRGGGAISISKPKP